LGALFGDAQRVGEQPFGERKRSAQTAMSAGTAAGSNPQFARSAAEAGSGTPPMAASAMSSAAGCPVSQAHRAQAASAQARR
jgi:hypothetical protein